MRPGLPPPDEINFALLDRFFAGECSPEEAELVRRWLADHEADARYVEAVRDALLSREAAAPAPDAPDVLWARLARDTVAAERNADRLPPPLRLTVAAPNERRGIRKLLATPWLRVAAAVVFVAGAAAMATVVGRGGRPAFPAGREAPGREYVTARGERAELRLPDGTRVVLAPDSRLTIPAEFAVAERTVALTGQAYFDVKHDARKPFQVRAGIAVAHDLGTRFDIRAYPGAAAVQVQVAQGEVQLAAAVAPPGTGPILQQGDIGRIDALGAVTTGHANLATALAWTHGELVFDDVLLSDVAADLARWYDLDFQIADPFLRRKRLTLTLGTESAPEAIEAVALLAGARYVQQGRTVTLIPLSSHRETSR